MRTLLLTSVAALLLSGDAAAQRRTATIDAVIISVQGDKNGTVVLFNAGTIDGVTTKWSGEIVGVTGTFTLTSCAPKRCKARSSAPLKDVRKSGKKVRVWP